MVSLSFSIPSVLSTKLQSWGSLNTRRKTLIVHGCVSLVGEKVPEVESRTLCLGLGFLSSSIKVQVLKHLQQA